MFRARELPKHHQPAQPAGSVESGGVRVFPNGSKRSTVNGRFDLIPPEALLEVAQAMGEGAERYGDNNWKGLPPGEILNHAMRHLYLYMAGDTKEPHLRNAAANVLMILALEAMKNGPGSTRT